MIGIGTVIKPGNENKTRNGSLKLVKSNILCSFLNLTLVIILHLVLTIREYDNDTGAYINSVYIHVLRACIHTYICIYTAASE